MSLWSQVFNVNIQKKKEKKGKKNTSMVKIISTITMLQFIKSWHFWKVIFVFIFSSRFLKQYVCVCVCVCSCRLRPTAANTHAHTHTQPTYAHSRTPTHTTCPLFFFFSGERHGAMERHSSSGADAPITRRRRGGGGEGSLPRLPGVFQLTGTLSKRKRDGERLVSFFFSSSLPAHRS